jgi:pimeloyl-ACP methyl ester carboxylesterase
VPIARRRDLRMLVAVPLLTLVALVGIVATTAWRTVGVVRPPRSSVDALEIDRELPESEQVTFLADDRVTLAGNFVPPKNGAFIVLVHGLFANRQQLLPEARLIAEHGYGVLIFDNRAHGASGGTTATWGLLESEDVAMAIDFVEQRTHLPPERIGLLGLSIGGTAVLREAVADTRIGAIVVEATYSSMGGEIEYMFGRYGPFSALPALWTAQAVGGLDYPQLVPEELLCALRSRPLLLIYGSDDSDVPIREGRRMADAACRPDALLVINGGRHGGFLQADAETYSERLLAFLDAALLA